MAYDLFFGQTNRNWATSGVGSAMRTLSPTEQRKIWAKNIAQKEGRPMPPTTQLVLAAAGAALLVTLIKK